MTGVSEALAGLLYSWDWGFTPGLKDPSKASGKAPGWVEPAPGLFLPHCSL